MMIRSLTNGRVHYAWFVAAFTFLTMLVTAGIRSVPGVLIIPLEGEFGWSRATLSLAVSINLLVYGLCGPFAAALMERLGMRRMMVSALVILGGAIALTTQMREAWQLQLLWGLVVGLGTGAMAGWLSATVANRWFVERRGLVVGLLTASNATGQLVFLPILAAIAVSVGWRSAVVLVAGAALVLIPFVVIFIRNFPEDLGLRAYGAKQSDPVTPRAPTTGNPFASALRTLQMCLRSRDFQLLAGSFFICGASTSGLIGTHLIPASVEHDIPEVTAASLLALIGIFDLIGTTVSGWLSDRYDNRKLLLTYYSLRGLSLLLLPYAFGTGLFSLALFVVFYGLDWVATVPPTVRLTADLFGKQKVGTTFAWIFASHQLGSAAAAFGAGALRTWLGDYQASFMAAGVLCLIAAGMVIRIGRAAPKAEVLRRVPAPSAS
ncbi:MAG: MFS transporter [Chloroflexi bacterium]|nr:MFS transporter [Chloroflexota bacterium]